MITETSKIKKIRETTFVEATGDFACLGAAMYLAVILYPDDILKRDDFVNACRAWIIKEWSGGQLKRRIIYKEDILKFSSKRKIDSQFNKAEKIIMEKRLPALVLFKLKLMSTAIPVSLSKKEKFSINKWIEKNYPTPLSESGLEYNKGNAYDRIWAPAKRIIHLVAGLENSITDKQKPVSIESLLLKPEWLPEAIKISENVRKIILLTKVIKIAEHQQISVFAKEMS